MGVKHFFKKKNVFKTSPYTTVHSNTSFVLFSLNAILLSLKNICGRDLFILIAFIQLYKKITCWITSLVFCMSKKNQNIKNNLQYVYLANKFQFNNIYCSDSLYFMEC